jgi:hypothetical protein
MKYLMLGMCIFFPGCFNKSSLHPVKLICEFKPFNPHSFEGQYVWEIYRWQNSGGRYFGSGFLKNKTGNFILCNKILEGHSINATSN